MMLQQTTPDTFNYFVVGYTVFFLVMTVYLVSLVVRYRNLKKELELLEELENEG
ncbi:MAG: CcmD family protein [Anaerolineae bacterium]|nr:MAG: CcmD family protein [Anaerolineae bacterium]